jgi:Molybdopterin-binding domain of aldehyde dehydrogenase
MQTAEFDKRVEAAQAFGAKSRWRKRAISCVPTKFGISFTTKFLNQAGALVHSASIACRTLGIGHSNCPSAHCSACCCPLNRCVQDPDLHALFPYLLRPVRVSADSTAAVLGTIAPRP